MESAVQKKTISFLHNRIAQMRENHIFWIISNTPFIDSNFNCIENNKYYQLLIEFKILLSS